jgi:hypothetical protein
VVEPDANRHAATVRKKRTGGLKRTVADATHGVLRSLRRTTQPLPAR